MKSERGRFLAAARFACASAPAGVSPQGDVLLLGYPRPGGLLQGPVGQVPVFGTVAVDGGNSSTIPNSPAVGVAVGLGQEECLEATARQSGLSGLLGPLAQYLAERLEEVAEAVAPQPVVPASLPDGLAQLRAALGADIHPLPLPFLRAAALQVQTPVWPAVAPPLPDHAGPVVDDGVGVVSQDLPQPLPERRGQI